MSRAKPGLDHGGNFGNQMTNVAIEWPVDPIARQHCTKEQLGAWDYGAANQYRRYQLVVVGGGLSGIAAAVAASRRGVRTIAVEETHMLGGQATVSGVAAFDITFGYERLLHDYGLWGEFVDRLKAEYRNRGLNSNTCRYRDQSLASNPVITDLVLTRMAKESGVSILRRTLISSGEISSEGSVLQTSRGPLECEIVVDATEDGSLLETLSVRHRVGRMIYDGSDYTGVDPDRCGIQDITQVASIQYYEGGLPEELKLNEPPNYSIYRRVFAKYFPSDPSGKRDSPRGFAGYRATPDLTEGAYPYVGSEWEEITRTSLNYHNDHAVNASYLIDSIRREFEDSQATLKTLSLLYFLQQECGEPWGVARDEGYAGVSRPRRFDSLREFDSTLRYFPPKPYVRESRRGVGRYTVTAKDIYRMSNRGMARWDIDSVAVGTYPPDLHGGRNESDLEPDLDEHLSDKPAKWREGPFGIPLGSLVHVDHPNLLLAEKNISISRVASGAARLHPTVFGIGEAVGVLAGICIRRNVRADDVPSLAVQASLTRGGALPASRALDEVGRLDPEFPWIGLAVSRGAALTRIIKRPNEEELLRVDRLSAVSIGQELARSVRGLSIPPLDKHQYVPA
ncbi:FAD-dependent oxidoreductase [Brevibacterium aurantiacum]|uniref:FAD-dependent oxidoreductase n=1 Tax=Brevibacterium aurantiacum TaxID=273384 RepID=UPI0013DDE323|nr:FAD-dependent oxidoreductase [Brevibacterium aurantiacum]